MKIKFLVTPVGLMMGNIESARRLKKALITTGVNVIDEPSEKDYDLLHVHTPIPINNIIEVKRAKKKDIPVIMHAHTTAEDSKNTWTGSTILSNYIGKYLTMFYNLGDLIITPSTWTRTTLLKRGVKSPTRVLSNGIDFERFKYNEERRKRFREKYNIPNGEKVVYLVGVMCIKKGIETLAPVARANPDVHFIWIGKRYYFYCPFKINRAISQCPDNVRFLNDVTDVVDAHCGCDIFLNPSFVENQGIAILEAMAVGRPIVTRNLSVYEGLLTNERNALLCNNIDDFINAIKTLKDDPLYANQLVQNSKDTLKNHDIGKVAKELVTIYETLLNDHHKGIASA